MLIFSHNLFVVLNNFYIFAKKLKVYGFKDTKNNINNK